jgi:hypothetical protein
VVRRFHENGNISPSLQYFCEAACKNSLQSLKFTVYNVHYIKEWLHDFTVEPNGLNAIESGGTTQMWEPLKLFRNLSSLEFESNPKTSNPAFERDLKTLTTSNEPVVHVFAMYRQLLAYTRAFERHHSFRAAMDTSKLVQSLPAQHAVSLAGGGWNGDMPLHLIDTPFRDFTNRRGSTWGHPVELGLWRARVTSDHNDLAPFKIEQAGVVWSLESQYQRIMAAETTFQQYIKAEKMKWGMLEADRQRGKTTHATNTHQKMAEGLVHLENFASTFTRDLAFQVTCNLRDRRRVFDEIYSTMPREMALKKVEMTLEMDNYEEWRGWFRTAAEDMDKQFLEIRAARRALFECDSDGHHGCDVDLETARIDEPVDWDVNERIIWP